MHRRRSHIALIDDEGAETLSRRIPNDPGTFLELLGTSTASRGSRSKRPMAGSGWPSCSRGGYGVHLAHPLRTKASAAARVKTDAVDARMLAYLMRADLLAESYIATREIRDLRERLRHRTVLTQMRAPLECRVHTLISRHG